jgi:hypothetical protein
LHQPDPHPKVPQRAARLPALLVSCLIATYLTLQFLAGFKILCPPRSWTSLQRLRVCCSPKLWPFLDYPMYNAAHFPGEQLVHYVVVGEPADSQAIEVTPAALGISDREYRQGLVDAMIQRDQERLAPYVARLEQHSGRKLRALRLENRPWVLAEDGVRQGAPVIICSLPASAGPGGHE